MIIDPGHRMPHRNTTAAGRNAASAGRCRKPASRRRTVLLAGLVGVITIGLVGLAVFLPQRARWEDTLVSSWSVAADDPLTLVVEVDSDTDGTNVSEVRARVVESDGTVRVTAWVKRVRVEWDTIGGGTSVTVRLRLKAPPDGRTVVDQNGRPIREKPSP